MNSSNLSKELSKLPAGYLPLDVFNQVARLGVLAYLELIAFRQIGNEVEVLLSKRSADDIFWPDMYHNPGTVLRPTDKNNTFAAALQRLEKDEYKVPLTEPFFGGLWFDQSARGKGLGIIAWVELNNCPGGSYFNINSLPESLIQIQKSYIINAAKQFEHYKSSNLKPTLLSELLIH